jgi:hypothetical protein
MAHITRDSLMPLETYARERGAFRAMVMAHKKHRAVHLGEHVTLIFEDELTMRYQIQEMLRAERIFEEQGIADELAAYNPLVPDGNNWKATMMVEYTEVDERRDMLAKLIGIEDKVWVKVGEFPRVYAVADEDMERENADKTSAVHFLRFDLTRDMAQALLLRAATLGIGVDHPNYLASIDAVANEVRASLAADIQL